VTKSLQTKPAAQIDEPMVQALEVRRDVGGFVNNRRMAKTHSPSFSNALIPQQAIHAELK
jgi:hypothetical protein